MTTATAQTTSQSRSRQVSVLVLDGADRPARGAVVEFFINGHVHGSVTTGAEQASIELPWSTDLALQLRALFGGEVQSAGLSSDDSAYTFRFETVVKAFTYGPGIARCPDGTAGQPCVVCSVAGIQVRICA